MIIIITLREIREEEIVIRKKVFDLTLTEDQMTIIITALDYTADSAHESELVDTVSDLKAFHQRTRDSFNMNNLKILRDAFYSFGKK